MRLKEFFAIKDKERQKWLLLEAHVRRPEGEQKIIDNDEKIGFYYIIHDVGVNSSGTPYPKSVMNSWVVYNKKTKKVKISSDTTTIYKMILEKYTNFPDLFAGILFRKPTATFYKRLIEGKIETVADYMQYIRSYTLRGVKVSDVTLLRYANHGLIYHLPVIENPDEANLEDVSRIPRDIVNNKLFKIKDVKNAEEEYKQWYFKNKELYSVKGRGDAEFSSSPF